MSAIPFEAQQNPEIMAPPNPDVVMAGQIIGNFEQTLSTPPPTEASVEQTPVVTVNFAVIEEDKNAIPDGHDCTRCAIVANCSLLNLAAENGGNNPLMMRISAVNALKADNPGFLQLGKEEREELIKNRMSDFSSSETSTLNTSERSITESSSPLEFNSPIHIRIEKTEPAEKPIVEKIPSMLISSPPEVKAPEKIYEPVPIQEISQEEIPVSVPIIESKTQSVTKAEVPPVAPALVVEVKTVIEPQTLKTESRPVERHQPEAVFSPKVEEVKRVAIKDVTSVSQTIESSPQEKPQTVFTPPEKNESPKPEVFSIEVKPQSEKKAEQNDIPKAEAIPEPISKLPAKESTQEKPAQEPPLEVMQSSFVIPVFEQVQAETIQQVESSEEPKLSEPLVQSEQIENTFEEIVIQHSREISNIFSSEKHEKVVETPNKQNEQIEQVEQIEMSELSMELTELQSEIIIEETVEFTTVFEFTQTDEPKIEKPIEMVQEEKVSLEIKTEEKVQVANIETPVKEKSRKMPEIPIIIIEATKTSLPEKIKEKMKFEKVKPVAFIIMKRESSEPLYEIENKKKEKKHKDLKEKEKVEVYEVSSLNQEQFYSLTTALNDIFNFLKSVQSVENKQEEIPLEKLIKEVAPEEFKNDPSGNSDDNVAVIVWYIQQVFTFLAQVEIRV